MKKILYTVLAIALLGSCKNFNFGDINQPKVNTTEPSPKDLLNGGIMNFFNNSGRSYFTNPTFYIQWQHQNIYTSEMRYADLPIDWTPWYVQVLTNFETNIKYVNENRNDPKIIDMGDPDNQIAINQIMKAYVFKFIADVYGDIPFTEALDPNNHFPAYDNQIDIYKSIISMLENARDMLNPSAGDITLGVKGDPIYGRNGIGPGQIEKWQKFANSLIMHAALQLSDVDPVYAEQKFIAALNDPRGVIETLDEGAWIHFVIDNRTWRNPFSRLRKSDYYFTKEFTDALYGYPKGGIQPSESPTYNATLDFRAFVFINDPGGDGKPYQDLSRIRSSDGIVQISKLIWNATAPLPILPASWVYLDRAEAVARGWATGDNYNTMLTQAIEYSYKELVINYYDEDKIPASYPNAQTLINYGQNVYAPARVADANNPTYGDGTTDPKLLVVAEEKWISYFPMGFEGWAQWRRLDLPALDPLPASVILNTPPAGVDPIPKRYTYPSFEQTFNSNNWQQAVQSLTPAEDRNYSRVPWDVN